VEVDISKVEDADAQGILRSLLLDETPPVSGEEMLSRARARRLDTEIDRIEADLQSLDPESDAYSDMLRRLVALQKEKRAKSEP
jgi:hypothetical protein